MSDPLDAKEFSNIAATTAAFTLNGGCYMVACVGTGFGTVDLQALGPDQSTWLATPTAAHFTANGTVGPVYLSPGQYRFAVATASAVYASVSGVPLS
jgi:hypothetical protein